MVEVLEMPKEDSYYIRNCEHCGAKLKHLRADIKCTTIPTYRDGGRVLTRLFYIECPVCKIGTEVKLNDEGDFDGRQNSNNENS